MNEVTTKTYAADTVAIELEPTGLAPAADSDRMIEEICNLDWTNLSKDELINVAWAYYYFSVQFRENLLTARQVRPEDELLKELERGECDTDNLSPWPGVAAVGERRSHHHLHLGLAMAILSAMVASRCAIRAGSRSSR